MKVAQVLPQTSLIEGKIAKRAKTALDIAKELNVKPMPISESINKALKITENNSMYFDGKTPTGSIEKASTGIIDYFI